LGAVAEAREWRLCYVVMWPGCDVASDSIKSTDRLPVRRRRMEGGRAH